MGCFSPPKTIVRPQSTLTEEQNQLLNQLIGQVSPEIGQAQSIFPGQRVAPLSSLQQQGLGLAGQSGGLAQGVSQTGLNTLAELLSGDNAATESARRLFTETIAPEILGTFAQTGSARSGGAQRALANAGVDLSLGLANQLTGTRLAALPQLAGFANLPLQTGAALAGLGEVPRNVAQQRIGAQRDIFRERQPLFNPALGIGSQLAGLDAIANVSESRGEGMGRNLVDNVFGLVGDIYGG